MDFRPLQGHIPDMQFTVTVCHDTQEGVWFVNTSDVPGLFAEATTLETLIEAISDIAPELVAFNLPHFGSDQSGNVSICVQHVLTAKHAAAA